MQTINKILSFFFKFGKAQTRWRDLRTGRFVKKPRMVRVTIGTAIYPVKRSQTKRYTLSAVVDTELVEETKERLLEEMYRKIERDVSYDRNEWWFEIQTGYEVIEVEGD